MPPQTPPFREAFAAYARIGLLSFGGPAGQIALMHRVLVEEKGWIDEKRFLHALNYCMLLPGPEAMQLATYAGWLLHGVKGGIAAGLLFVLPGAAVLIALSALYMLYGGVPVVEGLLFGLKAAVLAIVVEALAKVSKRALKGPWMVALAVSAFLGIAFFQVPFPIIVLGAAALGALAHLVVPGDSAARHNDVPAAAMPAWAQPSLGRFMTTTLTWLAIWLVPLALLLAVLGPDNVFARQASFFSIMATVTFGGAYAVLAWVAQQAVEVQGWLRPDEMLAGLGLAESTPGPLILVLVFVGFLGAARQAGLDPMLGGTLGGLVTLWFTFVPCFLWILAGAPYVEKVRNVQWLAASLSAVTAAVVGVIANLAVWFGLHVLFHELNATSLGPARILLPDLTSFDPAAALIAVAAGVALLRYHVNMIVVLFVAAAAGAAYVLML